MDRNYVTIIVTSGGEGKNTVITLRFIPAVICYL